MVKPLQAIVAVSALMLTAACASAGGSAGASSGPPASAIGSVTGKLFIEGGPVGPGGQQPSERPIPGTDVSNASRQAPCSQPLSVAVTSQHTTTITLTCIVP